MLLEVHDLYGGYPGVHVIKGVSCHADSGEILCLVGPNGCGKTTLFRLILGSAVRSAGSILLDGRDTRRFSARELAKQIAYIPQSHSPVYAYTVLDMVIMGRAAHFSSFDTPGASDRDAAFQALEKVNALHLADKKYTQLSGGQRQLILIARAICQSAKVLIMDEPAANLDYANHLLLMNVVRNLAKNGYCIILSTHSPEHPFSLGSKVLMLKEGEVAAFGAPKDVITAKSLKGVYGIDMDVITVKDKNGNTRTICLPVDEADYSTAI